jgi:D-glycerate 3-kinase
MKIAPALVQRTIDFALRQAASTGVAVVGLSGVQGSGKSTFANLLAESASASGHPAVALGLDDFYLDLPERLALAREVHPLLATRGVPGTHDIGLLEFTLAALRRGERVALPQFDKGTDQRVPTSRWPIRQAPVRLIVLEGWCLGVPPQTESQLLTTTNALEAEHDPDGVWRRYVNAALKWDYLPLWQSLGALIVFDVPNFETVLRWRDEAEAPRRAMNAPAAMSSSEVARFIQHFERIARHGLATLPALADLRLVLDGDRQVIDWVERTTDAVDKTASTECG